MDKKKQLGANIRSLRKAYGETQEQLGQAIGGYEKNAISYYENGQREPSKDVLVKIATHYLVSLEELLNSDLTSIRPVTISKDSFIKNLDYIFPIVSSERALKNDAFRKAYDAHKALYHELHQGSFDALDMLDKSIDGYFDAVDDDQVKAEAAANFLALWYLLMGIIRVSPTYILHKPAALIQLSSKDEKVRKAIEEADPSVLSEAVALHAEMNSEDFQEMLSEMLTAVKRSHDWSDLADYYLALRYVWNLVDNDLDLCINSRIGIEMMTSFVSVENPYAARYLEYCLECTGAISSQSVDDK